jgi:hypothetical protein
MKSDQFQNDIKPSFEKSSARNLGELVNSALLKMFEEKRQTYNIRMQADVSVEPGTMYFIPTDLDLVLTDEGLMVMDYVGHERKPRPLTMEEKKRFGCIKNIGK